MEIWCTDTGMVFPVSFGHWILKTEGNGSLNHRSVNCIVFLYTFTSAGLLDYQIFFFDFCTSLVAT